MPQTPWPLHSQPDPSWPFQPEPDSQAKGRKHKPLSFVCQCCGSRNVKKFKHLYLPQLLESLFHAAFSPYMKPELGMPQGFSLSLKKETMCLSVVT